MIVRSESLTNYLPATPAGLVDLGAFVALPSERGSIAARSKRPPAETLSAADQGLRYEPGRPPHIQRYSQIPTMPGHHFNDLRLQH